jgi:predicted metal-dependent peptidase
MDSIKVDDIMDKVDRGKIHAMLDFPMIEGDVSKMRVVVTTNVKTAATDGNTMWVNPHFINALDAFQVEFVVLHEWAHVFLKHFSRSIKLEDKELVQQATDQEANNLLKKANVPILDNALCDRQFAEMTMEQIYRYLKDRQDEEPLGPGPYPGSDDGDEPTGGGDTKCEDPEGEEDSDEQPIGKDKGLDRGEQVSVIKDYEVPDISEWGEVVDPGELTPEEISDAEFEDTIRQENTMASASLSGKLPESIEKHVRDIAAKSRVDWRAELADFVEQAMTGFNGYLSWTKPNKRYASMGIHMPSVIPESEEIAILVDSSGSMDMAMFDLALEETKSIVDVAQPSMAHVVVFDHQIVSCDSYEKGVEFPAQVGRRAAGGTDIDMALRYVEENLEVNGIIVISDMEFFRCPNDPGVPVLWVEVPQRRGGWWATPRDFGRSIRVEAN